MQMIRVGNSGDTFERIAELRAEIVVSKIHELGLDIAPHKTVVSQNAKRQGIARLMHQSREF